MASDKQNPATKSAGSGNMVRAGLTLGSSIVVKMLLGLLLLKLLASHLDLQEFGRMGQFMTLVTLVTAIAGGGQIHGLIKLLSSSERSLGEWRPILQTAHFIAIAASLIIMMCLALFAVPLTNYMVGRADLAWLIAPICVGLGFTAINNIQIAALSASGFIRQLAFAQVGGTIAATFFTACLLLQFGLQGAVFGFALTGFWNMLFSLIAIRKFQLIAAADRKPARHTGHFSALMRFSGSLLFAIIFMPLAHIFTRSELAASGGWEAVGKWQAINRLSEAVMQIYGTFLNNYVLALLSAAKTHAQSKEILLKVLAGVLGSAIIGYTFLYIIRDFMIVLLFTPDFKEIADWLHLQFIGDIFCLTTAVASNYFVARMMLYYYVSMQIGAALLFSVLVWHFTPSLDFAAPVHAHFVTFFTLSVLLIILAVHMHFQQKSADQM